MTLDAIKALVVSVDPTAGHYDSAHTGSDAYTVWRERRLLGDMADDRHHGAVSFAIDRFTKTEGDAIAAALEAALEASPEVCFAHLTDYEADTGYIHHIFDCEAY